MSFAGKVFFIQRVLLEVPHQVSCFPICSLCCAFLAFKIDEYNVTLEQFIETLSPFFPEQQLRRIADFILSHEVEFSVQ